MSAALLNRVRAGVPTGGQFARTERREATGVSLTALDPAEEFELTNMSQGLGRSFPDPH